MKKWLVRMRLALSQNRGSIAFVVGWLVANCAVFARIYRLPLLDAGLTAACLVKQPGTWPRIYDSFTGVVVFGLVASFVASNVTRRYRPEATCRELARRSRGHIVVVGYTNVGRRIYELAPDSVVVERDPGLVAALVAAEQPVVLGDATERAVLEAAAVGHARAVVIATDDLETAAVTCHLVRELNAECRLVVRAADDDAGAVLARAYRAQLLSTSSAGAAFVRAHATKLRAKNVLVLGEGRLGERTVQALEKQRIAARLAPASCDPAALAAAGIGRVDLVVLCEDDLGANLVCVDRIRALDKRVRIVCRAFHEDAALVLTRAPYECTILSTSRVAAEALVRTGLFGEATTSPNPCHAVTQT